MWQTIHIAGRKRSSKFSAPNEKNKKRRLRREQYDMEQLINKNDGAARLRTLLKYGKTKGGHREKSARPAGTGAGKALPGKHHLAHDARSTTRPSTRKQDGGSDETSTEDHQEMRQNEEREAQPIDTTPQRGESSQRRRRQQQEIPAMWGTRTKSDKEIQIHPGETIRELRGTSWIKPKG